MARIPLVRANNYQPIIDALKSIGAPVDRLTSEVKFPPHILETSSDSFVAEYPLWRLLEITSRSQGIENFGYVAAVNSHLNDLGDFGKQLCDCSTNLYDLLAYFTQTVKQHSTDCCYWMEHDENETLFCRYGTPSLITGRWQAEQYVTVLMIQLVRLVAGPNWVPSQIYFESTELLGIQQCELFANSRIYYGQGKTAIAIPNSLLCSTSPGKTPLAQLTSLESKNIPDNYSERLKTVLYHLVNEETFDIKTACDIAGTKQRSLQRRLSQEGLSFTKIIAQIRYEKASQLLKEQDINIIDISAMLGYSDHAHFTRAFRSWSGLSPTAYRAQYEN